MNRQSWPTTGRAVGRAAWPHLRALLVLIHLLIIVALTTPDLGGTMSRRAWKQPAVQRELAPWAQRFGLTPEDFENRLWSLASGWTRWRRRALAPLKPYSTYTGVRQRWRMFASPNRIPARYEIDIKRAGQWQPIYVSRSSEYTWRRALFDHDRMRASMSRATWPNYQQRYRLLCHWIATQVEKDFPQAQAVRVRRYRYATPSPDGDPGAAKFKSKYEGLFVHEFGDTP